MNKLFTILGKILNVISIIFLISFALCFLEMSCKSGSTNPQYSDWNWFYHLISNWPVK